MSALHEVAEFVEAERARLHKILVRLYELRHGDCHDDPKACAEAEFENCLRLADRYSVSCRVPWHAALRSMTNGYEILLAKAEGEI